MIKEEFNIKDIISNTLRNRVCMKNKNDRIVKKSINYWFGESKRKIRSASEYGLLSIDFTIDDRYKLDSSEKVVDIVMEKLKELGFEVCGKILSGGIGSDYDGYSFIISWKK